MKEQHLRRLVRDYVSYYHQDRIHDSLDKDTSHRALAVPGRVLLRIAKLALLSIGAVGLAAAPADQGIQKLPVIDRQDIRFVHLSIGGQPFNKRVLAINQDNYGFMWLGTDEGLYRYDGYSLRSYQHNPNNPRTLSDNVALVIYKDRSGTLWIGTGYGGLDRFDPALDAFTHYRHDPNDSRSLRSDQVWCIYQDRAGSLWIGTTDGLDRLDLATGSFTHYSHPVGDNAGSHTIRAIYEDGQGSFLFGGADGRLYTLDPSGARLSRFPNRAIESSRHDHGYIIRDFKQDRAGTLWASSLFGNEVTALNTKTEELRRYSFNWKLPRSREASLTTKIHEDRNRVLWVGTHRDGLLRFDPERKSFARYSTQSAGTFPDDHVWSLFEDSEGNLWVGNESGVFRFQTGPLPFVSYQREPGNPNSLRSNKVHSVYADKREFLWIGTEEGLHRLDRKTGQMVVYQHDPRQPNSLSNNDVSAIKEDSSGTLWIGTRGGGLNRFDRATGRFTAYRHNPKDPQSLHWDKILCLSVEPGGTLWAGTEEHGLSRMDLSTGRFKEYRHNPGDTRSLSQNQARSILVDRAGTLWVGTNRGLNRFERGHEGFTVYLHDERNPASISNEGINAIYEDHQGTLWIGTRRGLNRLDRTRGSFVSFTTQDGLANDAIQGIQEDSRGNLWLATQGGLSEFVPGTKAVRNFAGQGGLPEDFANPIGTGDRSSVTPEGDLVFGSQYGVTVFSPDRVSANPYRPPVVLTDFLLFNKPVPLSGKSPLQRPIWATQAITLDHKQSIFTLEFAALSYVAPERNRIRYKLDGLETEWNEVGGSRHVATYTELPPQTYVFRVQGSNNDLVWNETGARLEITVLPPWWATWWFRSLVGLLFTGLTAAAYRLRVRGLKRNEKRLDALVEQRTAELRATEQDLKVAKEKAEEAMVKAEEATEMKSMFLANMSHEIRTPMNAVIGLAYLALKTPLTDKQRDYVNKIYNAGTALLGVINDVLDFSKIEAGRLDIETVDFRLDDVIASVTSITAQKAQDKGLEFLAEVEKSVPQNLVGDPLRLGQVITNLINNAIKFTEQGEVYLKAELLEEIGERAKLRFSVKDTGIGMTPEQAARLFQAFSQADASTTRKHGGTGLGLTISKRLVERMGGEIGLETEPGIGSTFRFTVSVGVASSPAQGSIIPEQLRAASALVVDDNAAARYILVHALDGVCARVDAVSSGEEAIAAVKQQDSDRPYDVIFMDWRMPGMGGIQATRLIKEDKQLKTHPAVVLVTAFGMEEVREEAKSVQMDGFLLKPVTASMVIDILVTLFAGARPDPTALAPAVDRHAGRLRGMRILLAEDNEINQQVAVELLEQVGATVEVVNNGLEAVHKLLEQPVPPNFDVVLMDLQMPEMDGFQATKKIRSDPRFASFPIIAMTAHATIEERQKCLDAGMNGHVSKPIDPSSLFDTLERFVTPREKGQDVPVRAAAPTSATEVVELPDVPGLNTTDGLLRVSGNKKLYRKLLDDFSKTEADAAGRIAAALAGNDRGLAGRLAHTVKGVAGNIGATAVQKAAADLEKAIAGSSASVAEIEALRASLEERLANLIPGLKTALDGAEREPAQAGDPGQVKEAVEQLSRYLAKSNSAAIEYFEEVAPHLRILFGPQEFEHFASLIENYAFSEAYEELMVAGKNV